MTAPKRRLKGAGLDLKPCRREECGHGYVAHREAWVKADPGAGPGCMACMACSSYVKPPRRRP